MKISEFRAGLQHLQSALRAWGVARQAGELDALDAALQEFDDLTIAELVKQLKKINTKPVAPTASKASKQLNEQAIELYLAELKGAAYSSEVFERAVDRVIADKKQLRTAELTELARRFGGTVPPPRSTRAAVGKFIKSRRLEMRRQDGLGATIDRMYGRV